MIGDTITVPTVQWVTFAYNIIMVSIKMNALAECRTLTVTCMYACIAVQGVHPRVSNINSTTSTPKGVTVAPFSNNVHSSAFIVLMQCSFINFLLT